MAAHRDSLQALFTRLSAALQAVVGQEAFQGASGLGIAYEPACEAFAGPKACTSPPASWVEW